MNIRKTHVAAGAALALLLAGCGGGGGASDQASAGGGSTASGAIKNGGTLTIAMNAAPDTLDPMQSGSKYAQFIMPSICEGLFDVDEKLDIVPVLATALPTISADGKTYTIKLRSGVKFNDGTDFNADAVKTSLERYRDNPLSGQAPALAPIKEIKVVDPTTLELDLSTPNAPLTSVLANRAGEILSPAQIKKLGDKFGDDPVCVGPFKFQSRTADTVKVVKSDLYYDKAKVHLDGVTFQVITQPNVRAANLKSGDVQVAMGIAPSDVEGIKTGAGTTMREVPSLGYQGLAVNVGNVHGSGKPPYGKADSPLADDNLRKAFEMSLNRDTLNKVVFGGLNVPDCSPLLVGSSWYTKINCQSQNIPEAKKLVAASGVKTPIDVDLLIGSGNDQQTQMATVIQSMAKEAGFNVKVDAEESVAGGDKATSGKFQIYMSSWSGRVDPDQNIQWAWDPKSILNRSGADYPDINKLMTEARETNDTAKRKELYAQVTQKQADTGAYIILFHDELLLGISKKVSGFGYYGDGIFRVKDAGFTAGS